MLNSSKSGIAKRLVEMNKETILTPFWYVKGIAMANRYTYTNTKERHIVSILLL